MKCFANLLLLNKRHQTDLLGGGGGGACDMLVRSFTERVMRM